MEEKYKICDDALQKLLNWLGDVETTVSQQDVVKEDSEQLRNQINTIKVGKIPWMMDILKSFLSLPPSTFLIDLFLYENSGDKR